MLKRNYQKPVAEYVAFYSNEEITSTLPLANYANESDDNNVTGGVSGGWSEGSGDGFID